MKSQHVEISPMMQELSKYIAGAIRKPLPPEVKERAKIHLVDAFAAMISGSRLLPGKKAHAYIKTQGGTPEAAVLGSRIITSAANAALANGTCGHADESDDTHPATRSHPGTSIVPASYALAERQQLSGEQLLRAIVLGYDISARLLLTLKQMVLYASGHHAGAIGGVFGSGAASSALLKLDARKVRYVLSLCAEHAAGTYNILRDSQHIEKAYVQGGMPGHNGVVCALMVAHGFTGVEDVFTGDRDFITTFSQDADRAQLTRALGQDYEILRCAIKRWTVGGPIQGPLQVLHEIMREHGIKAGDVDRLVARMPDKELTVVDNRDMPDICVQHLLAIMLLDGTLTFKAAHNYARMRDPKVVALRKRMQMIGDPALTDAMRRWRCVMKITLKDGRTINHQTMAAKGSYENPQSREEEQEKALDLLAPVLTKRRAHSLLAALWDIDRVKNVRLLRKFVSA